MILYVVIPIAHVIAIIQVCTELIVHQKQIGVGLPIMNREEVIKQ